MKTTFVELPDEFKEDLVRDLLKDLEHKKEEHPYVESQVQEAKTLETEAVNTNDEFSNVKQQFDQRNTLATEQKKQNEVTDLIDYVINDDNPLKNRDTEDIYIEDDLFDTKDTTDIKDTASSIIKAMNLDNDIDVPSDDRIAIDGPKKVKIITGPNRVHLVSERIKKKCQKKTTKRKPKKGK